MLKKLLAFLFVGAIPPPQDEFTVTPPPNEDEDEDGLTLYGTFGLQDGHAIASDLKRHNIPFKVSMDSGIDQVDPRFGSGGSCAEMSLYVAEDNWEIVNDIIEVRYPR